MTGALGSVDGGAKFVTLPVKRSKAWLNRVDKSITGAHSNNQTQNPIIKNKTTSFNAPLNADFLDVGSVITLYSVFKYQ